MTQLSLILSPDEGSPFDQIRRVRPDGSEYWSARELMPLLGYEKWERFEDAIGRAEAACRNSGQMSDSHFSRVREENPYPGLPGLLDVELSRMACYFVAMNGDPRKSEIAAAQTYFVINTRENEVRKELSPREQAFMLARQLLAEGERADRAETALAIAGPKIEAYDEAIDRAGRFTVEQIGGMQHMPGRRLIWGWLSANGYLTEKGLPYARYINQHLFVVTPTTDGFEITPKGYYHMLERRMRERGRQVERL